MIFVTRRVEERNWVLLGFTDNSFRFGESCFIIEVKRALPSAYTYQEKDTYQIWHNQEI